MSKAQELADALDRMDNLLNPEYQLLAVHQHSATAVGSRADMALIRAALSASSEQQAAQQDAETLTVEEILHIQQTHVGGPCPSYPLDNSDWINFARAIEARVIAARASNGGKA